MNITGNISNSLYVATQPEWREWLEKNHQSEKETWLIFFKKHTGKPCISYEHAVEEALCWGWIDSIVKRIDTETYARKFTPRNDMVKWSELNLERIRKLIKQGKVTEAGLAKIDDGLLEGKIKPATRPGGMGMTIPPDIEAVLSADPIVWQNFNNLAASYRGNYLGWIGSAKKEETRQRRLKEVMELLAQNKKLGLK
jgi:uncharacterized protein YdeI (YjbR/CyaY-like superfamily)